MDSLYVVPSAYSMFGKTIELMRFDDDCALCFQAPKLYAPPPPLLTKATFGTGLEVLQCSRTFISCDWSPVTQGHSVAKYPLLHDPC